MASGGLGMSTDWWHSFDRPIKVYLFVVFVHFDRSHIVQILVYFTVLERDGPPTE